MERGFLHLRVKDAGIRLDDANSAIVGNDRSQAALAVGNDGGKGQLEILGVHLGREAVADSLLRASGDLDGVASSSQVADNGGLVIDVAKTTSNEVHRDGIRLIVGNGDQRLGRVTIDKLDAEDLGSRERCLGRDGQSNDFWFSILRILQCESQSISQLSHATWTGGKNRHETYSSKAGANEGLEREQSQREETKASHLETENETREKKEIETGSRSQWVGRGTFGSTYAKPGGAESAR
jgi:hypothetical protein